MPALDHALLGVSVLALAAAGLRVASPLAERGLARVIAAAVLANAFAVAEALLLGLVALGGSQPALALAALATAAGALVWLPRPAVPLGGELAGWWRDRGAGGRAAAGAVVGAAGAWAVWQLVHPLIGFDSVIYHVPEMVIFVQGGHPGSVHDVLPGLPVGNYPLSAEVSVAWAMAIGRSFVPLTLWPWLTLALTAVSGWAGLRALRVGPVVAATATAALCTSTWVLAWQSNGSVNDPPALAFLAACAALCAMARGQPRLLAAAVVAGGLAIGCKTTVLPSVLVVLALGLLGGGRARLRSLPWRAIGPAAALAALVGSVWYVRNLAQHGSPFWPISATPWGDPVPHSVAAIKTSFLARPRATIDVLGDAYLDRFGGGVVLLAAGVLAPLAAPRRRVLLAAAVAVGGFLLWAASPITGLAPAHTLPETVFSTTRYLLPVLGAACVALALAATDGRRLRPLVVAVLAGTAVLNLVQTIRLGGTTAPTARVPLAGALAGAALAGLAGALLPRLARHTGRLRRPPPRYAAVPAAMAAGALLAIPAAGFVERYGGTDAGPSAAIAAELARDPQFRDGSHPVATTPAYIGPLAGDRLEHRLEAIHENEDCAALTRRTTTHWVVAYGGPLGGNAPERVERCLPAPAHATESFALYRPGSR